MTIVSMFKKYEGNIGESYSDAKVINEQSKIEPDAIISFTDRTIKANEIDRAIDVNYDSKMFKILQSLNFSVTLIRTQPESEE